jgi:hypothetical protein
VKENISISFSFPNISNTFSNDFWNHFLLEIKTNHTDKNMQRHVCTNTYLTLYLILFIKKYYFTKFPCTYKCITKSNSPI